MKLKDIYSLFVKEGMKADPRTKAQVAKQLSGAKKKYKLLKASSRSSLIKKH